MGSGASKSAARQTWAGPSSSPVLGQDVNSSSVATNGNFQSSNSRQVAVSMPPLTTRTMDSMANGDQNSSLSLNSIPRIAITAKNLFKAKRQQADDARTTMLQQHPELKDALESVDKMMKEMEQDSEGEILKKMLTLRTYKSLSELYDLYFEYENKKHREIIGDQLAKDGAGHIFTEYIKVLKCDEGWTPKSGRTFENASLLKFVCWNFSDASLPLCEEFGRMGMLPELAEDLVKFKDKYETVKSIQSDLVMPALSILHNCAKSPDNKKYYKQMNAVEAILPYTKSENQEIKMISILTLAYIIDEKDNKVISTDDSMVEYILSYLESSMENEDHRYEGMSAEELVSGLMHLASNDDNSATIVDKGILPFLVQLMKEGNVDEQAIAAKTVWVLAFNNKNKSKISEQENMEEALEKLSQTGEGQTKKAAAGALWVLDNARRVEQLQQKSKQMKKGNKNSLDSSSFSLNRPKKKNKTPAQVERREKREAVKKEIAELDALLEMSDEDEHEESKSSRKREESTIAEKFREKGPSKGRQSSFKSKEKVAEKDKVSEEVEEQEEDKFFAEEEEEEQVEIEDDLDEQLEDLKPSGNHIMISYQWNCQKLMIRVKEKLEQMNYRVWMDIESMGGSTLQAMAEAVEEAEVLLMCMSQKYKDSPNCRTEAEYAYKLGKEIVPLKIEQGYDPDGWLGAILGAKLFFDFSSLMSFENIFAKLTKELLNKAKASKQDGLITPVNARALLSSPIQLLEIQPKQWSMENIRQWASRHGISSNKILHLDGAALEFLHNLKSTAPEFFYKYASDKLAVVDLRDLMSLSLGLDNLYSMKFTQ